MSRSQQQKFTLIWIRIIFAKQFSDIIRAVNRNIIFTTSQSLALAVWLSACLIVLWSCANQVALTGGPRDERPPELDTLESFSNYQTSFENQDIELYFDEFVSLQNPGRQIIISPPLAYPPEIDHRGKRISLKFNENEVLKEDATYVINFGEAIEDFTEGNKLDNFTLVFSTGLYIDSLSLKGNVRDAFTGEEVEDVLIMLYETLRDSVVFEERPFYFAKSLENGSFEINNIREDTFKVVALKDGNLNYLYDPPGEEIGFLDFFLVLTDSFYTEINLEIFREKSAARFVSYEVLNLGKIQLQFTSEPDTGMIRVLDTTSVFVEYFSGSERVTLWYKPVERNLIRFEYIAGDGEMDTVSVRINRRNTDPLVENFSITEMNDHGRTGLHPEDSLSILFDRPLSAINGDFISVIDTARADTLIPDYTNNTFPGVHMHLDMDWYPAENLLIEILPGGLTDFFGQQNDTIIRYFRVGDPTDFGSLRLNFRNFPSDRTFSVRLINEDRVVKRYMMRTGDQEITATGLVPGDYEVEIIDDKNQNGNWDPGIYLEGIQSEDVYNIQLEELRENWELEQTIDYNDLIDPYDEGIEDG